MGYNDRWNSSNCTFDDIMKVVGDKEIEEILEFVTLTAVVLDYSVTYEFVPNSMYIICFYKEEGRSYSSLEFNISFIIHPTKKYLKEVSYGCGDGNSMKSGLTFDFIAPVKALKNKMLEDNM